MSDNKATHEVVHPRLFLGVNGKLQHVEKGTLIVLGTNQAKKLGDKVKSLSDKKTIDLKADQKKK